MTDRTQTAEAPQVASSVGTTFRRTLVFAAIAVPAVFASALAIQSVIYNLGGQTLLAYCRVMTRWYEGRIGGDMGPASPLAVLAFGAGASPYFLLMGFLFRRWQPGAIASGAVMLVVVLGLAVPSLLPYAAFGCALSLYVGQIVVAMIPVARLEKLGVRGILRHFRVKNLLWLVLSMGFVFYYLLAMGYFVAMDWLVEVLVAMAGGERYLPYFVDPTHHRVLEQFPWAIVLYSSVLGSMLALYHVMCSAYGMNQLDYLVDRGKEPIVQRKFWWPFRRGERADALADRNAGWAGK
jgi:hypothetical protein